MKANELKALEKIIEMREAVEAIEGVPSHHPLVDGEVGAIEKQPGVRLPREHGEPDLVVRRRLPCVAPHGGRIDPQLAETTVQKQTRPRTGLAIDQTHPVAPQVLDLDWARGSIPTVRGTIAVAWRRDKSTIHCDVELPANVSGTLVTPRGEQFPLAELDHRHRNEDERGEDQAGSVDEELG